MLWTHETLPKDIYPCIWIISVKHCTVTSRMIWTCDLLNNESVWICLLITSQQDAVLLECSLRFSRVNFLLSRAGTPFTDAREALRVSQEQAAAEDSQRSCWGSAPSRDGWVQTLLTSLSVCWRTPKELPQNTNNYVSFRVSVCVSVFVKGIWVSSKLSGDRKVE